jgi:UDP-N-acetylmuramate dehydrogenase
MIQTLDRNIPLARHTTLKVGGPAAFFVSVTTEGELQEALAFARAEQLPVHILGGGSNLFVPDAGVSGLVIKIELKGIAVQEEAGAVLVTACAGESFDALVLQTVQAHWWGLENLSYIPGTVGATPIQNVGAYGVEVSQHIRSARVMSRASGEIFEMSNAACQFGYRDSIFKQPAGLDYIVTAVTFRLSKMPAPQLHYADLATRLGVIDQEQLAPEVVRDVIVAIRQAKFPDWNVVGTAGSFFKNPIISKEVGEAIQQAFPAFPIYPVTADTVKVSLAFILDKVCGLKGYRRGHVRLYEEQPLVLVAEIGATASEIKEFANEIKSIVFEKTNIAIEWEVSQFEK